MRILVVDDEFVALTKMLKMLSVYGECEAATHARQAFDMFQNAARAEQPYGLLAIDIHLPDIDGLELVRMVCRSEKHLGLPAAKKVIVSIEGSTHNVLLAARCQCDAFLVKPVTQEMLEGKLLEIGLTPSG